MRLSFLSLLRFKTGIVTLEKRKGKVMSEHFLLGLLVILAAVINLYGLIILRDVHRLTNETLLKVDSTFDLVRKK